MPIKPTHNFNVPTQNIPKGATHYDGSMVSKFFKYEGDNRFVWFDNEWSLIKKCPVNGWKLFNAKPITELAIVPNKPKVMTPNGEGTLVKVNGSTGVDLDVNPFCYRPAFYHGAGEVLPIQP